MPILVDKGQDGSHIIAGPTGAHEHAGATLQADADAGGWIEIALINNMPDAALEATEQQFLGLLAAAAGDRWCRVRFFCLPGVPRGQRGRDLIASYGDIGALWNGGVDGLIVTGTEPIAQNLSDEPYWPAFTRVVDWAARNTISTVWSCLASHAAVLHLDGISRLPLHEKCFGVFACEPIPGRPFTAELPKQLRMPHARLNGLGESTLLAKGYDIITRSREAGVDMFVRNGESLFLFLQGHPEYGAHSLLNEYRRDIGRFLRGERDLYPPMPKHYFDNETAAALHAFEHNAREVRSETLMDAFPATSTDASLINTWQPSAVQIYRNWLAHLAARTDRGLPPLLLEDADSLVL
jgi:homoserine O-succinyltransferase